MNRKILKKIVDEALGVGTTRVEESLSGRQWYIYTEVWTITSSQLSTISKEVEVEALSVDGGWIMITARKR